MMAIETIELNKVPVPELVNALGRDTRPSSPDVPGECYFMEMPLEPMRNFGLYRFVYDGLSFERAVDYNDNILNKCTAAVVYANNRFMDVYHGVFHARRVNGEKTGKKPVRRDIILLALDDYQVSECIKVAAETGKKLVQNGLGGNLFFESPIFPCGLFRLKGTTKDGRKVNIIKSAVSSTITYEIGKEIIEEELAGKGYPRYAKGGLELVCISGIHKNEIPKFKNQIRTRYEELRATRA